MQLKQFKNSALTTFLFGVSLSVSWGWKTAAYDANTTTQNRHLCGACWEKGESHKKMFKESGRSACSSKILSAIANDPQVRAQAALLGTDPTPEQIAQFLKFCYGIGCKQKMSGWLRKKAFSETF